MASVSFPTSFESDIQKNERVEIPVGVPLEAEIREVLRIMPFEEESETPIPNLAICVVLYDRKSSFESSYAMSCQLSLKKNARIWKLLRAITGKGVGPSNLSANNSFEFDKLINKHFSVMFSSNSNKPIPTVFSTIAKEKWTDLSKVSYVRPGWVTSKLYVEESTFNGTLDEAFEVEVSDEVIEGKPPITASAQSDIVADPMILIM